MRNEVKHLATNVTHTNLAEHAPVSYNVRSVFERTRKTKEKYMQILIHVKH